MKRDRPNVEKKDNKKPKVEQISPKIPLSKKLQKSISKSSTDDNDSNQLVLEAKKKVKKAPPKESKQLTKEELKKETALTKEAQNLLYRSSSLGKVETSNQKIERAKKEISIGIPVSVDLSNLSGRFKLNRGNVDEKWNPEAEKDLYGLKDEQEEEQEEEELKEDELKEEEEEDQEEAESPSDSRPVPVLQPVKSSDITTKKDDDTFLFVNFGKETLSLPTQGHSEESKELISEQDEAETHRDRILQGFDKLIDLIAEHVKDKEISSKLIMATKDLMDICVEDSDDEGEEEQKEDEEIEEDIVPLPVAPMPKTDVELIHDMISEQPYDPEAIRHTKFYVLLDRDPIIQAQREKLPIYQEEQQIMEAIHENDVLCISGETGSGKTTQTCQFLYEAGYSHPNAHPGMICITQPRRIAAISTSTRVAQEMNVDLGGIVGYHVRYDNRLSAKTKIKFVTDGILMQEIEEDPLLLKYSIIILDEAHERNLNTDILIGWLSRFIPQRNKMAMNHEKSPQGTPITKLKLIIMSATLRVSDFTENVRLFPTPPPVLNIKSRQFPVTVHFSKKTEYGDYVSTCFEKVTKIHTKLPPGGILVILTGKDEIDSLVTKLNDYSTKHSSRRFDQKIPSKSTTDSTDPSEEDLIMDMGNLSEDEEENIALFEDNIEDENVKLQGVQEMKQLGLKKVTRLHVLPLYSMLSPEKQSLVFQPAPEGSRLVVVATNVAETSLTIPGIRYVVDSGRVKDKVYEDKTGISKFVVKWTSKASSDQRAGRSGRTGPGHCYRLYSASVFDNQFPQFTDPDILRIPIENVILQMKNMGIQNIEHFPFPTPPVESSIKVATNALIHLGAIDKESGLITQLGRDMEQFPVHPRFAKMLIMASQTSVLDYVVLIVCALTVQQVFINKSNQEEEETEEDKKFKNRKKLFANPTSDLLSMLTACGGYEHAINKNEFCKDNYLHAKNMKEVHSLRLQLIQVLNEILTKQGKPILKLELKPQTPQQEIVIRQVICSAFVDQVARITTLDEQEKFGVNIKRGNNPYMCHHLGSETPVYIHPTSFVVNQNPKYAVYAELTKSVSGYTYMRGVTEVEDTWLSAYGKPLCTFSDPIHSMYNPKRDEMTCFVEPSYGTMGWKLSQLEIEYPRRELGYFKEPRGFEMQLFAKYFLEGKVFVDLAIHRESLVYSPSELTNPLPSRNAKKILNLFFNEKCYSAAALKTIWKTNPNFLKMEYLDWIKPNARKNVVWPPKK